jgi:hypothetical protein
VTDGRPLVLQRTLSHGLGRSHERSSRWLAIASVIALLVSFAALYARYPAFEGVLQIVSGGRVSPDSRAVFSRDLLAAAMFAATASALLAALAAPRWRHQIDVFIRRDALHDCALATPNPYVVMSWATLSGLLVIGLWAQRGLGTFVQFLFRKEGPLEDLTFVLELAGAALCLLAARAWKVREPPSMGVARGLYAALGLVLFLVAMEEISWGQTLFGFATPDGWARMNYQHETSIHNLVDRSALTAAWKIVSISFGVGALAIVALGSRFPRSLVSVLAPHSALVPLALCAAYAGAWLHPELVELLLSIFFAFYGYRIWRAASSNRTA